MKTQNISMNTQESERQNSFSNFQISSIFKLTLVILVTSLAFISCKSGSPEVQKLQAKKPPLVKVQPAKTQRMVAFIDITGTVQANIFTDVKTPASGIVESLMARENQRVEKGRVIAIINPTDRVSLISKNQQQIEAIEKKLSSTPNGTDEYNQLVSELQKAKESLEYARNMYQTIPVICPMSGLITQRWVDSGGQVTANEKMLTITDMSSLVVKAEVNEKYFEAIKLGKKLPIILNAYPNDTLLGTISLIYPQVDEVTRSVKFDIKIVNFNKNLLPGMMASIKIPVSVNENAVTVPSDAVLTNPANERFVFVINKDSIAFKRIVKPGISEKRLTEITFGLNEDENIVVMGQEMLKDSLKVKIAGTPKNNQK